MRACVQIVKNCSVIVDNTCLSNIQEGLLVYLGIENTDNQADINYLTDKIANLRIFKDENDKMNLSVKDKSLSIMVISQFTLLADARKGRRPSYDSSMNPESAKIIYEAFINEMKKQNISIQTGKFGAEMIIDYKNIGPVTILLDSKKNF